MKKVLNTMTGVVQVVSPKLHELYMKLNHFKDYPAGIYIDYDDIKTYYSKFEEGEIKDKITALIKADEASKIVKPVEKVTPIEIKPIEVKPIEVKPVELH